MPNAPRLDRTVLRLGARGSLLSRLQSGIIARLLEKTHPGLTVELIIVQTSGDKIADKPLHEFGGKGLFTKELEQSLLDGEIDFAVHSFKDVPVTMPLVEQSGLAIAAVPTREDARDVLVCRSAASIGDLPPGARVGTGSLRRRCQLLSLRPDLRVEPIRGNIDTRLRKLAEGAYDAIVLAAAGLRRAGLFDGDLMMMLDPDEMLPAPGQGALALQCRRTDHATLNLLAALNDPQTAAAVEVERQIVRLLEGDCHSPIASFAESHDGKFELRAAVGGRDGSPPVIRASACGDAEMVVHAVYEALLRQDARKLLHG